MAPVSLFFFLSLYALCSGFTRPLMQKLSPQIHYSNIHRNQLQLSMTGVTSTTNCMNNVDNRKPLGARIKSTAGKIVRFLLPIVLPVLCVYLVSVSPAFAKAKKASKTALKAASAVGATTAVTAVKRKKNLLRKILEGVNADGGAIIKKAGDTRGEFSAILNSFSSMFILMGLSFVAFLKHKHREMKMDHAMTKELDKIKEYKENMYFEAVQTVLEKLADTKLKGSTKANLQKQLKDLDPDGVIKKFLEEKGERPDISYLTDRKKKKKPSADKFSSIAERKPKKSTPKPKSTRPVEDEAEDDQSSQADEEDLVIPPPPSPPPAPPVPKKPTTTTTTRITSVSYSASFSSIPAPPRGPSQTADESDDVEPYLLVLNELYDSLEGVLPNNGRKKLVEFLKSKIDSVTDPAKREVVVSKIAQKLGANDYWIAYTQNLG